ncbi:MAG: Aldehyde dehydrogenase [Labilithrix sp.]|nr:Aldehyde dehydrogenase [Labilithrix sp.]
MTFAMTSPATGDTLSAVLATTPEGIIDVVKKARAAQLAWAALDVGKRIKAVSRVKQRVLARAADIARSIHEETGKPEVEALLGEVLATADVVAYWADIIADELEPFEAEIDALSYPKKAGLVHREARGTIGLIMPWNFPFALPFRTLIPALLAGNAVVFKPSEVTPRTGQLIVDLFQDIIPEGLVGIIQGGGDAGAMLCGADVDLIVFTGSPTSGRKVAHACAERLIPCTLELGGKDAAIVLADADLERAANGIVWGAMMNAGQNCGAVERVYADKKIVKELTEKVVAATRALRVGEDVGPLTTDAQHATVVRHVEGARKAGADILVGGEAFEDPRAKRGYRPTVLTIDADEDPIVAEETFGPVLPITAVDGPEEAIRRANASRYGLTASLWTADLGKAQELARTLRAGVVTINNHSFTGALPSAPWGGVGETGWGITGSPLALDHLTRPRLVLVDRNRAKREMWWYPYTPTLKKIALAFAALRGGAPGLGGRLGAIFSLIGLLPKRMGELKRGTAAKEAP